MSDNIKFEISLSNRTELRLIAELLIKLSELPLVVKKKTSIGIPINNSPIENIDPEFIQQPSIMQPLQIPPLDIASQQPDNLNEIIEDKKIDEVKNCDQDIDTEGAIYDTDKHSVNRLKNKNGTWKKKMIGRPPKTYRPRQTSIPLPQSDLPVGPPPPEQQPLSQEEIESLSKSLRPVSYQEFWDQINDTTNKITEPNIQKQFIKHGIKNIAELAAKPHLIAPIYFALGLT